MVRAEPYPISPAMQQIADNPTNPWLHEYLMALGQEVYKYSTPRKPGPKTTTADKPAYPQFDAKDAFIKHLASKVQVDE